MLFDETLAANRRAFLGRSAGSLGSLALASLMNPNLLRSAELASGKSAEAHGVVYPLHTAPRIKRVIFLYMSGGPSQFETFDNKPELAKLDREPMPASVTDGQPIAQLQGQKLYCMGPQIKFRRWGQSGQEISELFPQIGGIADQICIIRSMHTDQINHDPAHTVMNTGTSISGRPSMGSWVLYGLGSESQDLPGFVVLTSEGGRSPQPIHNRMWHSGFLPSRLQGVRMHSKGDPVHYLASPPGVTSQQQADVVESIGRLNRLGNDSFEDPEVQTRISQYELAFRMQMSVPKLIDFSDEPEHVLDLYGTRGSDGSFAANCLLARRMAERGVRFIQLYHRGWDHHNDLVHFMNISSGLVDKATAALVTDLKQRGMLDETLIVWGGEFGRTPMAQGNKGKTLGRDHHMRAFSMWLAGGGIKGGITYGSTDDLGYHVATDHVHVNDLHATMLHLLGIDHKRLTYRFQGRDFRLTDVGGKVLKPILG